MDERRAASIAERWSGAGGRGLVPRGPTWLLGWSQAVPADVERHTGRRPSRDATIWRLDVGGRFLHAGGLVYPGGVPYPEELARQTAVVSSEVWLYVEEPGWNLVGTYSWPEAVRRPIASVPRADFPDSVHPEDARSRLEFSLRVPAHPSWEPAAVVIRSRNEAILLLTAGTMPDPLNEMLLFEQGGLSLREAAAERPDLDSVLRGHQPPFRSVRAGRTDAIGREPGRALGPQTWPWPAELLWWERGVRLELKGFVPLATLQEVSRTLA